MQKSDNENEGCMGPWFGMMAMVFGTFAAFDLASGDARGWGCLAATILCGGIYFAARVLAILEARK